MLNLNEIREKSKQLEIKISEIDTDIDILIGEKNRLEKSVKNAISKFNIDANANINDEVFLKFFEKPYVIEERHQKENYIIVSVPKFIQDFQVGWMLDDKDETFFKFRVDQYSNWFEQLPDEIKKELNLDTSFSSVSIEGNIVTFDPNIKKRITEVLKGNVISLSDNQLKVKTGYEFDVIRKIIESGRIPFKRKKVIASDIREQKTRIELYDFQKETVEVFMNTGAVGCYLPTGAGKSIIALAIAGRLKGKKLIVTYSRALIGQWQWYLEKFAPEIIEEFTIITYAGANSVINNEYDFVIYDEAHRLPARTFSRLALIKTKYRLGLSATPFREDLQQSWIIALTGHPVGTNWKAYMKTVGKKYHPVNVHLVETVATKITRLGKLFDPNKRTVIFCDSLDLGKKISRQFDIPFVFGETKNAIDVINSNPVIVMSRVGDAGIHIDGLQRIIEIDFLFGSRQQEVQRTGRLMHSDDAEMHDIIMTYEEMEKYGKRLWGLQEKGFTVKVIEKYA